MSNTSLTDQELRNWILSLPPESIRSLEEALKSIREQHYKEELHNTLSKQQQQQQQHHQQESVNNVAITVANIMQNPSLILSNSTLVNKNTSNNNNDNTNNNSSNDFIITNTSSNDIETSNESMDVSSNECKVKLEATDDTIDISAPSRTDSPTSSNISATSKNKLGKTYENGRRNLKEENVPEEEAHRRAKRRERNRLAAAKCRKRRQDKIETLQQKVTKLKTEVLKLNETVVMNSEEKTRLDQLLESHKCSLQHQQRTASSSVCMPTNISTNSQASSIPSIKRRPNSLPLIGINNKVNLSASSTSTGTPNTGNSNNSSTSINNSNNNSLLICSLSPQLVSLSPLLTPSTMKLLLETLVNSNNNGNHSNNNIESVSTPTPSSQSQTAKINNNQHEFDDENLTNGIVVSMATNNHNQESSSLFSRSLSLLNLLSSNSSVSSPSCQSNNINTNNASDLLNITSHLLQSPTITTVSMQPTSLSYLGTNTTTTASNNNNNK